MDSQQEYSTINSNSPATPIMQCAMRIQQDVANVGFDWPKLDNVFDKLSEETIELKNAISNNDKENITEEIGDLFFTLINLSRHLNVNPDLALQKSIDKFVKRFQCLENIARNERVDMAILSLEQLEEYWQRAKNSEDGQ